MLSYDGILTSEGDEDNDGMGLGYFIKPSPASSPSSGLLMDGDWYDTIRFRYSIRLMMRLTLISIPRLRSFLVAIIIKLLIIPSVCSSSFQPRLFVCPSTPCRRYSYQWRSTNIWGKTILFDCHNIKISPFTKRLPNTPCSSTFNDPNPSKKTAQRNGNQTDINDGVLSYPQRRYKPIFFIYFDSPSRCCIATSCSQSYTFIFATAKQNRSHVTLRFTFTILFQSVSLSVKVEHFTPIFLITISPPCVLSSNKAHKVISVVYRQPQWQAVERRSRSTHYDSLLTLLVIERTLK